MQKEYHIPIANVSPNSKIKSKNLTSTARAKNPKNK